ncbi:hypothetical protein PPL_07333 [Heterostelium album PN500]|uniref:EF-hand domain-containing protein n=1 Tax=Heterostelium pallidum (strain ATCC 26659 / Pp 5 / PN500) TaxID=670386 RepID=D3BF16_HETP5|nr:hypothetical protein PPL_07333 [Heterostelium album PN500]EFA80497.1 hypothetical protein PPL_07333 [Heterostelium album PN500]|eukprot:XP_020432617.1 hypothetical protein PPL_07333 [Heterostelium album PN500]
MSERESLFIPTFIYIEFIQLYKDKLGFSESTMKSMFNACDADKDGKIDIREFASLISICASGSLEQKLAFLFAIFDDDQNGQLDIDELNNICSSIINIGKHGGKSDTEIHECISQLKQADINGDGKVSIDEWIIFGTKNPIILSLLSGVHK